MNFNKIVVITPVLSPPDPRSIDEMHPVARKVWISILKNYNDKYGNILDPTKTETQDNENLVLTPIFSSFDEEQWKQIDITVDNVRRNKKKMKKAEQNISLLTNKTTNIITDNNIKNINPVKNNSFSIQEPSTSKIIENDCLPNDKNIFNKKSQFVFYNGDKMTEINNKQHKNNFINDNVETIENKCNNNLINEKSYVEESNYTDKLYRKKDDIKKHKTDNKIFTISETKENKIQNVLNEDNSPDKINIYEQESIKSTKINNDENEIEKISNENEKRDKIIILKQEIYNGPKIDIISLRNNQNIKNNIQKHSDAINTQNEINNFNIVNKVKLDLQKFSYKRRPKDNNLDSENTELLEKNKLKQNETVNKNENGKNFNNLNDSVVTKENNDPKFNNDEKKNDILTEKSNIFVDESSNVNKINNDILTKPNKEVRFSDIVNIHSINYDSNDETNMSENAYKSSNYHENLNDYPMIKPKSTNEFLSQEKLDYIEDWCDSQTFNDLMDDYIEAKINANFKKSINIDSNTSLKSDLMELSTQLNNESSNINNDFNNAQYDILHMDDKLENTAKDTNSVASELSGKINLIHDKENISPNNDDLLLSNNKSKKKKINKTKVIKKKLYNMEVIKLKPGPQPKRIQTKITNMFKPIKNTIVNKKECINAIQQNNDNIILKTKNKKTEKKNNNAVLPSKYNKRKHKFLTPIQSQVVEKNLEYEFHILDDGMAIQLEKNIIHDKPMEICFNVIYNEGFCQMSQPNGMRKLSCTPEGIMLGISSPMGGLSIPLDAEFYYIKFDKTNWKNILVPRSLLKTCLTVDCRKICFKSQSLFILLMDEFSFTYKEVSLEWLVIDPQIGCWLLDPDHPPTSFQGVMSQLQTTPNYRISSNDKLLKSCDMLVLLAKTTEKLKLMLEEKNLWKLFIDIELKVVSILSVMEHRGILCNIEELRNLGQILKNRIEVIQQKAFDTAQRPFQLNSTVQVRHILYDQLKLDTKNCIKIKETATLGAKSTSEPMLQMLRKVHPLPGLILEYRHLHKAKSTYVESIIHHVNDGTVYTTWEITGAATGRITSSNPNLQAVPKHPFSLNLFPENKDATTQEILNLRSPYNARPDHTLLAADFQHIELRVFAHISQDKTLLAALKEPGDIFLNLTRFWLGDKDEKVIAEHRDQTKRIMYAIMYGAGPGKLADFLSIEFKEAASIIKDFTGAFKGLKEFGKNVIEICRKQGFLTSLAGRRRIFPNINSTVTILRAQSERQAVNFCIQGSAADICKMAMITTEEKLKNFESKLLLQIHDELVWEVLDSQLEDVKRIVKDVMENINEMCGNNLNLNIPFPVSLTSAKNWGAMI